jgi:low molecular weight protein-tyrosine phosphatase
VSLAVEPFVVLHVCMGNICRSPMAERLLAHEVRERIGDRGPDFVLSESAGTGGWHAGEAMNPPAAKELRRRGALDTGFRARKVLGAHLDTADLILTATAEQLDYVAGLRPDAMDRAFVLGEFERLVRQVDTAELPAADGTPAGVHARGVALVRAVNAARDGAEPQPGDDLDDPWGRDEAFFSSTADEIADAVDALADALLPKAGR